MAASIACRNASHTRCAAPLNASPELCQPSLLSMWELLRESSIAIAKAQQSPLATSRDAIISPQTLERSFLGRLVGQSAAYRCDDTRLGQSQLICDVAVLVDLIHLLGLKPNGSSTVVKCPLQAPSGAL